MSIYLWANAEIPDKYLCICDYERFPDWFHFSDGRGLLHEKIESTPIFSVKVSKAELKRFDCLSNNIDCPIVNERVAKILQEMASDDIEFFDAKIICTDGVFLDYRLVNIIHATECIDHEKSIYRKMVHSDSIAGYQKPVYKIDCMKQHLLVRDKDFLSNFLVNQAIYDRFRKEKIKGVELITPHDFYKKVFPQYYQDE